MCVILDVSEVGYNNKSREISFKYFRRLSEYTDIFLPSVQDDLRGIGVLDLKRSFNAKELGQRER